MISKARRTPGLAAGKIILLAALTLLFIFLFTVYVFLNFYKPVFEIPEFPALNIGLHNNNISDLNPNPEGELQNLIGGQNSNDANIKPDFYNILVVCTDDSNGNTDTIMVLNLDIKNKECNMLQIPRDTYTDHASWDKKINSAFPQGRDTAMREGRSGEELFDAGMDSLKNSIRKTFGIAVHCYAYMELAGFRELVDIVGGVTVDVPFNMKYDDPTPGAEIHINLSAGVQLLDGDKAEQFMRFRKNNNGGGYPEGDVGRLKAQHQFIASLVKKCMKLNFSQLSRLTEAGYKYIKTDLKPAHLVFFAKEFIEVGTENITIYTAPGESHYRYTYNPFKKRDDYLSYYLVYKEEMLELANGKFNAYNQDLTAANIDLIEFDRELAKRETIGNKVDGFDTYD